MVRAGLQSGFLRNLTPALLLLLAPAACASTQQEFEQAAAALEFFASGDFLYGRMANFVGPSEAAERYNTHLGRLFARVHPASEMIALLQHQDPKVRTLAAAGLFATEDPQVLPHLAALARDNAPSFPRPLMLAVASFERPAPMPPMQPQTVGQLATAMVQFYMQRSGMFDPVEGRAGEGGFAAYWTARGKRRYCAGWFEVRLDRATRGQSPLPLDGLWRIHELLREIESLPPVDRELTLLAVFHEPGVREVIGERALLHAGRRLGPDRLIKVLAGESLSDDPDLAAHGERIRKYVLANVARLLRSSDSAALRQLADKECRAPWFIATAELQPAAAREVLHEGLERCKLGGEGRASVATALWRLGGKPEAKYLLDWFHTDRDPLMGRPPYRAGFVGFLLERFEPDDRSLLAAIVRDPRFGQLDWPTLQSVVSGLNQNLLHPLVDPRQVENASHPLGQVHFDGMLDRAQAEYPRQTAELLAILARWRKSIRESVPHWAPEAAAK